MYDKSYHYTANLQACTFLVTGGAGFIGSHIVEYLLRHQAKKVRVLDDLSTGQLSNVQLFEKHDNYEFIEGDIRDYETCVKACDGIQYLSHQAAIGSVPRSVTNPMYTTSVNVSGFVNVLKAAQEQGVQRIVYASSSSVYGDENTLPKEEAKIGRPLSPYAASKLTNEVYADVFSKVYNMKIIGLRYFNVFGPRQSPKGPYAAVIPLFIEGLLKQTAIYINGDGLQSRDFTFVENAVQANIRSLFANQTAAFNQAFNVAVGQRFSVLELYQMIAKFVNSKQQPIHRDERVGDVKHSLANISKAQKLLNYQPKVYFPEGLQQTIDYFKVKYETGDMRQEI